MEKQTTEPELNEELVNIIYDVLELMNNRTEYDNTCAKNLIENLTHLIDNLSEAYSDKDYLEEEYDNSRRENESLKDDINYLNSEIDDLKEQLSNKD